MSLKLRMRTATDTTLRHLAMLKAIPVRPRSKSTRQILEELRGKHPDFDVSIRSIQRSLERLSELFPITSETRGRTNYWYWIEPDALTQIPAMSDSTAFVLRLAADYLRPIMPPATLRVLDPYFRHAERILGGTALGRWTDRAAIIAPGPALTPPAVSADVQEAVYEALMTNRKVDVRYRGKHEEESRRIVLNPLGIVVRTGIVYLVATSWKYEDIRHYVLHRMSEARLTDEPAKTPPDFAWRTIWATTARLRTRQARRNWRYALCSMRVPGRTLPKAAWRRITVQPCGRTGGCWWRRRWPTRPSCAGGWLGSGVWWRCWSRLRYGSSFRGRRGGWRASMNRNPGTRVDRVKVTLGQFSISIGCVARDCRQHDFRI